MARNKLASVKFLGGFVCFSKNEGLCFPFVRLYINGEENPDLFALIENNIRAPHKTLGDLRAQASACLTGMRRYLEVIDRFGLASIEASNTLLIRETEERLKAELIQEAMAKKW